MGFVITNRMIQSRNIIAGDVGRVAEDAVKLSQRPVRPFQCVHRHGNDPAGQAVPADILPADFQRRIGKFTQHRMDTGTL